MIRSAMTVLFAVFISGVVHAQEKTIEERLKALEDRAAGNGPEVAPRTAGGGVPVDVFFKDGMNFRTGGGELEAHIGGTFVFNARFFFRSPEKVSADTFQVRQARIVIEGKLFKDWEFRVQPTASNGGSFVLDDGYVGFVRWTGLKLRAGQFKAPFGLEQLQQDAYTDFPERSVADRLVPAREIGVMVHGEPIEKMLSYQLMVSNGTGRNSDDNSDKDLTARIWVRPGAASDFFLIKGIHFGAAATYGRQEKAAGTLPYTYSDPTTQTVFARAAASAGLARFDEKRHRLSLEFAWLIGPFKIQAEGFLARDRYTVTAPLRSHDTARHEGGYVLASIFVTGDEQVWDRVRPRRPLFGADGGVGAISIAGRVSWFRVGHKLFSDGILNEDTSAKAADEYQLGVNWYPNANIRINVAYAFVNYTGKHVEPVEVKGKSFDREDVLIFRIQVDF